MKGGSRVDENKALFEEIYNKTKERVYKYIAAGCCKLGDIDDIYQNTYISIYNTLCRGENIREPEAFAIHVAKRELGRYYGLMKRIGCSLRSALPTGGERDTQDTESYQIEDSIADKVLAEEIEKLLSKKDIVTQKIFFLYYYLGMTLGEIAESMGIGESKVKRKLYSTLEQLRRLYRKE